MNKKFDNCWNTIGIWSRKHSCEKLDEVVHCYNCEVYRQATAYVYDAAPSAEYRDECTQALREPKVVKKIKTNSVLTFEIAGEWLAIPSKYINEITPYRKAQSLPHNKNPYILGIVNISGEIEVSFSLENVLELSNRAVDGRAYQHVIITEYKQQHYVFPVIQLGEVYRYHSDDLKEVPNILDERAGSFMHGLIKWKNRQVGALDAELLFTAIERSM